MVALFLARVDGSWLTSVKMKRLKSKILKKRKVKKLKIFFVCIILFIIFLGAFISVKLKSVEKTEEISEGQLGISIESPLNQTYYIENIILKVTTSKTAKWIADSIDGSKNLTTCYSCNSYTVYYLIFGKGTHAIKVYASDFEDKITKSSVIFTVK